MEIRTAVLTDARAIATVHVASERAAYQGILPDNVLASLSVEKQDVSWRERIANRPSTTLVADEAGSIWGWVNFGRSRDSDSTPSTGEIRAMYVSPERWRCGVGTALWQHSRSFLERAGYLEVTLWVLELNDLARQFYEKAGFILEKEIHKTTERGSKTFQVVRYRRTT